MDFSGVRDHVMGDLVMGDLVMGYPAAGDGHVSR